MQLVTLTAPDGHSERWGIDLAILALKLLKRYLEDVDGGSKINPLAEQVKVFVGDDLVRVNDCLTYLVAVDHNHFQKLNVIAGDVSQVPQAYIILKELDKRTPSKRSSHSHSPENNALYTLIKQVTGNNQRTIQELADLTKLFLTGQLRYSNKGDESQWTSLKALLSTHS